MCWDSADHDAKMAARSAAGRNDLDIDISWLDEKGISTAEGLGFTGGKEKYISAIQRFYKGYEANRKLVEDLLTSGDIEGYGIKVHSLKSNSRMIGAHELADAFAEMEVAAKADNTDLINDKTSSVLSMYADIVEVLRPIGEAEPVKAAGEISAGEAKDIADRLLEALDDFDDELSAELAGKLMGYPFRLTQKEKLKEAADNIGDFMYDEAAELIREIIPAIE